MTVGASNVVGRRIYMRGAPNSAKMKERDAREEECTEEIGVGPVDVFHKYGVAAGSDIGERLDEESERVRTRISEMLGAVGEGMSGFVTDLFGTSTRAGVYVALRQHDGATTEEIADEMGIQIESAEDALEGLREEGAVRLSDGRYEAVEPAEFVRKTPERVGDRIRESIGEGDGEVSRVPIRGEKPEIDAEYDEESGEVTVNVEDPGDADYVEVLVGSEVKKYFEPPSEGDKFTVKADREQSVVARSGCIERS